MLKIMGSNSNIPFLPPIRSNVFTTAEVMRPSFSNQWVTLPPKTDRQSLVEWRVGILESTIISLLDKMSLMKSDLLDQLKRSRKFEMDNSTYRNSIEEEVQLMMRCITEMNDDVKVKNFREKIENKWENLNASSHLLHKLENNQNDSLLEIRKSITKNDCTIEGLAEKTKQLRDELKGVVDEQKRDLKEFYDQSKSQHLKAFDLQSDCERIAQQATVKLREELREIGQKTGDFEVKLQDHKATVHQTLDKNILEGRRDLQQLENRLLDSMDKRISNLEQRVLASQQQITELRDDEEIVERISAVEHEFTHFKDKVVKTFKELESRMQTHSNNILGHQRAELQETREELQQGLSTVHEMIADMKIVLESKIHMCDENMRQELTQLRNLIILV